MSERQNMNISGASSMAGGEYGIVNISGAGKVLGDLKAEKLNCSGASKILGNARLSRLSCSGATSFEQDLHVSDKCVFSGVSKVLGNCSCRQMETSGTTKIAGSLTCSSLSLAGLLKVEKGIESEILNLDGAISVAGLLNSEEIRLKGRTTSKINEIGCSSLKVMKGYINFFEQLFHPFRNILEVNVIECDTCELEKTTAKIVRGRNITIKKGCHIDRVEYYDTCHAAPNTVKEMVKL